jgi:uncharacterized membrane protein
MVVLPPEAVIVSLGSVPESIESRENKTVLVMPEGSIEITYAISVAGTREHALALIREAEDKISEAKNAGVNVAEAENLLGKAKEAFNAENYAQAEAYAKEALEAVEKALTTTPPPTTPTPTTPPPETITTPPAATTTPPATTTTPPSETTTSPPPTVTTPPPTETTTPTTTTPTPTPKPSPGIPAWIIGAITAVIVAALAVFLIFRRKPSSPPSNQFFMPPPVNVELNRIMAEYGSELRAEDQQALQLLADSGGRLFESELRDKLNLPRTSVWRLVKRLEKLGIVEIRKIGGQNLICVKDSYLAS